MKNQNIMDDVPLAIPERPVKFIHQVRALIRQQNKSWATEKTYIHWIKRFINFHKQRHPKDMGEAQIAAFLNDLAVLEAQQVIDKLEGEKQLSQISSIQ